MLTQNQQSIIDSLTQEFVSFNEQKNSAKKSFNFFDTSVLDAYNQSSKEQIEEARITNKAVVKPLVEVLESDFNLLKKDLPPTMRIQLSIWLDDEWKGDAQYERDSILGKILIEGKPGASSLLEIRYYAHGKRYTADNGETYVVLDGTYRVVNEERNYCNIVEPTLSDLFANDIFVQRFTKFYREFIK